MRRLLLGFSLFASGCVHNGVMVSPDQDRFSSKPAIIFVPGYYGSYLRDVKTKKRVFVTAQEILFGKQPLSLYQKELATPPGPEVEPDGIFENVRVVPGLYTVDVYGKFLRSLSADPNVQVIPFSYDWRKDLIHVAGDLQKLIAKLKASGVTDIRILAHSMGGMVTLYSLAYGAQEPGHLKLDWRGAEGVRAVAFMGVPFRGVLSPFRNMNRGTALSYNTAYFPAETVASFPASYQLLSYSGGKLLDREGHAYPLNLEDPEFWRTSNAALFKGLNAFSETVRDARLRFSREQIERGVAFARALRLNGNVPPPASLKLMNVVGTGRKVMTNIYKREGDKANPFIFDVDQPKKFGLDDKLIYSDGDGTVAVASAEAPERLLESGLNTIKTTAEHGLLFTDGQVRAALDRFLKQ